MLKCVKSILPNTENWLRKLYDKNYNNDTSNEDKQGKTTEWFTCMGGACHTSRK